MEQIVKELTAISNDLKTVSEPLQKPEVVASIEAMSNKLSDASRAFSGSWLGYHSCVYYRDLAIPPAGTNFSSFSGLAGSMVNVTRGDWVEYPYDDIYNHIKAQAIGIELDELKPIASDIEAEIESHKQTLISILSAYGSANAGDDYVATQLQEIKALVAHSERDFVDYFKPSAGKTQTQDMRAATAGSQIPPHISVGVELEFVKYRVHFAKEMAKLAELAAKHIRRVNAMGVQNSHQTKIFIGHGQADDWKELRDYLRDILNLDCDEFNRETVAGLSNSERLTQMMDDARFAFLVMTAEDETADGELQARMNVVHEAGLFQGRLGFRKAILLVENGCKEFSNVTGLGQIRYHKGNMAAKYDEIRRVLVREGMI